MVHNNTLETDKQVKYRCIEKNEETGECKDKTEFAKILKKLLIKYKTKIRNDDGKINNLKENLNDLKTFVKKNTNEKLSGGNPDNLGNPDNTILDDENIIKEIKEQFTYLTKTPDFITKIKDFLEKNNIFKTDSDSEPESESEAEQEFKSVTKEKHDLEEKKAELERKKAELKVESEPDKKVELEEKKAELVAKVEEKKAEVAKAEKLIQQRKAKKEKEKEKKATNKPFEIKIIDKYDMFISESESESDKLKKKYYFNIDYYDSQPKFQEFKTHFNQLKELKKEYQDLILIFESAITELKKKKTNLEKLINTYFKNSLSTKRETLNKFDDFIKNITKNVKNIKDIPKNLINFLEVKKSNIETSLIQKSFPSFLDKDKIGYEKLTIDPKHQANLNVVDLLNNDPKNFEVTEIIDENNKTFTLEHISKKIIANSIIFTYKMKNSENIKSNHKLVIKLDNVTGMKYEITKIEAEIDNNIKISDEIKGGFLNNFLKNNEIQEEQVNPQVNPQVNQQVYQTGKPKESAEIKGLKDVFNNLQKKIDYVIKQKIRDGVDVSGVKSKDIEKGDVGDDIIETLVLDYERKKQNVKSMDEKERIDREFLEKVNGLGLNLNEIFEVNLMDKFYFILYSLVLHIITYSIIESLIMSSNLNSLVSIMGIYSFLYVLLIILTLGIIHIYGYRGKVFLNYLNLDHNFYNIIGHFIIVAIFFGIILILSQYINTANIENEDERVKMLYRIEIITGVMFVFTTMFILIL